jgi:hypothetical protein
MNAATILLRDLRPPTDDFDPEGPEARERLDLILAAPPLPPSPPRRSRSRTGRRLVAVAALLAVAVAGASLRPSEDVIARAAEALSPADGILHVVARERFHSGRAILDESDPSTYTEREFELWQTPGRRQERYLLYGGRFESVRDADTETDLTWVAGRDEIVRHTDPALFTPGNGLPARLDAPMPLPGQALLDVARILRRAEQGDENVRLAEDTTVRGVPVHEVRISHRVTFFDPATGTTHPETATRVLYVDREDYLPVRIVELGPGGLIFMITDYLTVENLQRTPDSERLLEMSPHPGAKLVVER